MKNNTHEIKIGSINKPELADPEPTEPADTSLADVADLLDRLSRTAKKPKAPINGNAPAKLASKPRPRSLPVLRPETPAQKALKIQQRRLTFNCDKKIAESDYDHTEVSTIDLSRERREGEEQSYESKSGYIMATALTAAAFSSYLVVKSFRALFL